MTDPDDALTHFKHRITATKAPSAPPAISIPQPHPNDRRDEYKAFETKDRVEGLAIRRRKGQLSYIMMHNYIHSVGFDDDDSTLLLLVVSGYHIEIRGRNLVPIAEAIQMRCCRFIQEFRPDRFAVAEPADPKTPFIESISVELVHPNGEREPA